jgi:hypothetical protein
MDEVERLLRTFRAQHGVAWKLDVLLDLGVVRDPRVVPFMLDVLADADEAVAVRLDVLKRLRNGRLAADERPNVALVLQRLITDASDPVLRLHAALALAEFVDVSGAITALANAARDNDQPFDVRYAAFTSLQRAGPIAETIDCLRRLCEDDVLGRSAGGVLRAWHIALDDA